MPVSPRIWFNGKLPKLICFQRNHFQDSTTARTVLATILEIIEASGDDLNSAYPVPQTCPMLKCFHFSTTPMDQIHHIVTCGEASKGEIRCMTCRTCHDFKRWHAVCQTLKSPVESLRKLSNRKRGSMTKEVSTTMRTHRGDRYKSLLQQESHGVEAVCLELHADDYHSNHISELGDSSAVQHPPTPPPTRTHISELGDSSAVQHLPTPPCPLNASHSSKKSVSIFSNSFPASRIPNPHRRKQNTWPMQIHRSNDIQRRSFDLQHPRNFDGVSGLADQQDPRTEHSLARQASFDTGAQDSINVSTLEDGRLQTTSRVPAESAVKRRTAGQQRAAKNNHRQYEECDRCGQQFGGEPKNRRQHLKRHVAFKHGEVRFRCGQPGCTRSYIRVDNLHDHERKCHGHVLPSQGAGVPEVVAELAAGDVEVRDGGGGRCRAVTTAASAAEAEGSVLDTGHHQAPSALDPRSGVFEYSISIDDGQRWGPAVDDGDENRGPAARRIAGSFEEELDALMADISGGQQEPEDMGVPDIGHGEADTPEEDVLSMDTGQAPRPLGIPCVSWR